MAHEQLRNLLHQLILVLMLYRMRIEFCLGILQLGLSKDHPLYENIRLHDFCLLAFSVFQPYHEYSLKFHN